MTTNIDTEETRDTGVSLSGLRYAVFTTRNFIFLVGVLAMNYTLMRPSPVDMLYILSFLVTLFYMTISQKQELTRRALTLTLLLGSWAVSYILASLPYLGQPNVIFELLAKTFAISIGLIGAFVSMTWTQRHFETFMRVYIVSCVIGSILGTIGFVTQNAALTWDGRARGLIDQRIHGTYRARSKLRRLGTHGQHAHALELVVGGKVGLAGGEPHTRTDGERELVHGVIRKR